MSPEPFGAIQNAVEHYRIDGVLISTLAGEQSKWVEEGLIEKVKEITDVPIEHIEASDAVSPKPVAGWADEADPEPEAPVAVGAEQEAGEEPEAAAEGSSGGVAAGEERSD
jgi:hypothetical protein